jgi:hypothetical protein
VAVQSPHSSITNIDKELIKTIAAQLLAKDKQIERLLEKVAAQK